MAWRKSWSTQNLDPEGTKRKLTPEQRSVWDDCLDLAEMAPITGTLCIAPGVQYTAGQLAAIFSTPEPVIVESLKLFRRLSMIDDEGRVTNWPKYQSEYQRQKRYRK